MVVSEELELQLCDRLEIRNLWMKSFLINQWLAQTSLKKTHENGVGVIVDLHLEIVEVHIHDFNVEALHQDIAINLFQIQPELLHLGSGHVDCIFHVECEVIPIDLLKVVFANRLLREFVVARQRHETPVVSCIEAQHDSLGIKPVLAGGLQIIWKYRARAGKVRFK